MYTRDDLREIRSRAVMEANVAHVTYEWRHACLDLAAAADHLDALTARIEFGEIRAAADEHAHKPQRRDSVEGKEMIRVLVLDGNRTMFEQWVDNTSQSGLMPSAAEAPAVRDALDIAAKALGLPFTLESTRITRGTPGKQCDCSTALGYS